MQRVHSPQLVMSGRSNISQSKEKGTQSPVIYIQTHVQVSLESRTELIVNTVPMNRNKTTDTKGRGGHETNVKETP